jgi:hypothetical protein
MTSWTISRILVGVPGVVVNNFAKGIREMMGAKYLFVSNSHEQPLIVILDRGHSSLSSLGLVD